MNSPRLRAKPTSSLKQLQVYRVWGTAIAAIAMVVFTSALITTSVSPLGFMTGNTPQEQLDSTATQQVLLNNTVVQGFIAEIQAATSLARGKDVEGTWYYRAGWNKENPCLSRMELLEKYSRRKYVRDVAPNPLWRAALREYSKLHRTCMHRVGNVTEYFLNRDRSSGCKFTVVETDKIGMGNRFLVIASALMYSILTNRVILLGGNEEFIPMDLMCEPFEGSTWRGFDVKRVVTPYLSENQFWNDSRGFHDRIDHNATGADYAVANIDVKNWVGQPQSRFFCDVEQESYKNVTFVYLTGMIYFLPKLFTVPSFRPVLEALFPDRMALTWLLRDVMLPADAVWTRVKRMEKAYFEDGSDRRLGMQLRYRKGWGEYQEKLPYIAGRVLQCALENDILPRVSINHTAVEGEASGGSKRRTTVFVASLYDGVKNNLTETFLRHPTETGETVEVIQLSTEGSQKYGVEVFQGSLAEVLILSFSDYLFVTPRSTFSGLAQAYGGMVPWFIDWRDNITESGPCTRAQTVDVCFQAPFDYKIKCPYDRERHEKEISNVFPDVQPCLEVDTMGVQLITKNDLSMNLQD